MTAKSISIKGAKRKSGGRARKAVGLISGDLGRVPRGTEGIERLPDPAPGVSRGRSTPSAVGLLDRDTRLKGEKQRGVARPETAEAEGPNGPRKG